MMNECQCPVCTGTAEPDEYEDEEMECTIHVILTDSFRINATAEQLEDEDYINRVIREELGDVDVSDWYYD